MPILDGSKLKETFKTSWAFFSGNSNNKTKKCNKNIQQIILHNKNADTIQESRQWGKSLFWNLFIFWDALGNSWRKTLILPTVCDPCQILADEEVQIIPIPAASQSSHGCGTVVVVVSAYKTQLIFPSYSDSSSSHFYLCTHGQTHSVDATQFD